MADDSTHYPRAATEAPSERIAKMEIRLENGQREFMALREEQRALRGAIDAMAREFAPKPMSRMQLFAFVAGPVIGVALLLGGFVWQAARYPDRVEFDAARAAADDAARSTERKLIQLESAQTLQARDVATVQSTTDRHDKTLEKLDAKVERLLTAKGK